jgi:hypothetical protein
LFDRPDYPQVIGLDLIAKFVGVSGTRLPPSGIRSWEEKRRSQAPDKPGVCSISDENRRKRAAKRAMLRWLSGKVPDMARTTAVAAFWKFRVSFSTRKIPPCNPFPFFTIESS